MVIKGTGTPIQLFQILNVEHHMFKKKKLFPYVMENLLCALESLNNILTENRKYFVLN